jgi:hypothetical protein
VRFELNEQTPSISRHRADGLCIEHLLNQLDDISCTELAHDVCAMKFDGAWRNAECAGRLFTRGSPQEVT